MRRVSHVRVMLNIICLTGDIICQSRNVTNRRKALRNSILNFAVVKFNGSRNTWKLNWNYITKPISEYVTHSRDEKWIRIIGKSVINSILISVKETSVYLRGLTAQRYVSPLEVQFHISSLTKRLSLSTTVSSNDLSWPPRKRDWFSSWLDLLCI